MARAFRWARGKHPGVTMLRRGAWYPVLDDEGLAHVLLGVGHQTLAVPRSIVEIQEYLPSEFSVVELSPEDPNPVHGRSPYLGRTYAVCPWSRTRVRVAGRPRQLLCPDCGHRGGVAWQPTC